jgi:hypothetical protein
MQGWGGCTKKRIESSEEGAQVQMVQPQHNNTQRFFCLLFISLNQREYVTNKNILCGRWGGAKRSPQVESDAAQKNGSITFWYVCP